MKKPANAKYTARQRALTAAGIGRQQAPLLEVHHVVEHGRKIAAPARANLAAVGLGLHDPANLVLLPKPHQTIHTSAYTEAVIIVTGAALAFGYSGMVRALESIKFRLIKNGRFP